MTSSNDVINFSISAYHLWRHRWRHRGRSTKNKYELESSYKDANLGIFFEGIGSQTKKLWPRVLSLGWPRGGFVRPPPMFFRPTPYPGGNLVKTKMIHEPNSFADILKKIACNFIQPFSHSNYVLKVYRGGFVQPPPKTDQRGCPRGGVHRTPPLLSPLFTNRSRWNFHTMSCMI